MATQGDMFLGEAKGRGGTFRCEGDARRRFRSVVKGEERDNARGYVCLERG